MRAQSTRVNRYLPRDYLLFVAIIACYPGTRCYDGFTLNDSKGINEMATIIDLTLAELHDLLSDSAGLACYVACGTTGHPVH